MLSRAALAAATNVGRTHHAIDSEVYTADSNPDRAQGRIAATAHHWSRRDEGIIDLVWYLRYDDEYVRGESGWLMARRALTINAIETRPTRRLRLISYREQTQNRADLPQFVRVCVCSRPYRRPIVGPRRTPARRAASPLIERMLAHLLRTEESVTRLQRLLAECADLHRPFRQHQFPAVQPGPQVGECLRGLGEQMLPGRPAPPGRARRRTAAAAARRCGSRR